MAEALDVACNSGFDFLVYDIAASEPAQSARDLAFMRTAAAVKTSVEDAEGHFISFRLGNCSDGHWPSLAEIPRLVYIGDGTYGEFREEVDAQGVYRTAPSAFDLMINTAHPSNGFDLVFDVVPPTSSLRFDLGGSTMSADITAGQSLEIRVPLCITSSSEKLGLAFEPGPTAPGSGEQPIRIRRMRVLPVEDGTADRPCDSVRVSSSVFPD